MQKLGRVETDVEMALRYELINAIPELNNQVYPTNAPEGADKPYLVYMRSNTDLGKDLDGFTGKQDLSFVFNPMAVKYSDMKRIRDAVERLLINMPETSIGEDGVFFVEDININRIEEQYEHQLGVNRGIVDFTIYFKKENE